MSAGCSGTPLARKLGLKPGQCVLTEDVICSRALPLGWVDVTVCAVDAVWPGLKLVVRQALR